MTWLRRAATRITGRVFSPLTKEQADLLASIKFPCC